MNSELDEFVKKSREQKLSDDEIKQKLKDNGWSDTDIGMAIGTKNAELEVPKPPIANNSLAPKQYDANNPIPVVNNLSTKGFEYSIMFVSLWASAISLAIQVNTLISNAFASDSASDYYDYSSGVDTFWITVLVVFAPVFIALFVHLKRQELANPAQLKDPSRRRLSHFTQFLSFLTGAGILIYFIYSLMSGKVGQDGEMGYAELILHVLATLLITGSVFAYYWIEEHKSNRQNNQSLK